MDFSIIRNVTDLNIHVSGTIIETKVLFLNL